MLKTKKNTSPCQLNQYNEWGYNFSKVKELIYKRMRVRICLANYKIVTDESSYIIRV